MATGTDQAFGHPMAVVRREVVLGGISLTALEKISIRKIIFTARKVRFRVQQDMHASTHRFPGVK